jgi:hypothetical protein
MSCCNEITVNVQTDTPDNITVYIDEKGVGLLPILNFFQTLSSNYQTITSVTTNVISNSAAWFNQTEINELNTLQELSACWEETCDEVNFLQQNLSANWQSATEYINTGVIDPGYF